MHRRNRTVKNRPGAKLAAQPSAIDLSGIRSADLVVRGSEAEGYSFDLEKVQPD